MAIEASPVHPPTPQRCLRDILDGFFPSELRRLYPDGVPFKVTSTLQPTLSLCSVREDGDNRSSSEISLPKREPSTQGTHPSRMPCRRGSWDQSEEAVVDTMATRLPQAEQPTVPSAGILKAQHCQWDHPSAHPSQHSRHLNSLGLARSL